MAIMSLLRLSKYILSSNFKSLPFPYKLTFSITYRCNLRCKTCNIWQIKSDNELSLEELKEFFKKSYRFSWVDITGGEIFLRDDLIDIIKLIKENCRNLLLLHFPTNGFLTRRVIKMVKEIATFNIPKLIITVSMDGYKELHDEIKGVDGSWERSIDTFNQLRKIRGVKTYFGMTLSFYNADKFRETYLAVKKELGGVEYRDFHINIAHSSFYYNYPEMEEMDKNFLIDRIEEILKLRQKSLNPLSYLESRYLSLAKRYLQTDMTPIKCQAFSSSCFIDPYGDVYPCSIYDYKIGNIRDFGYDIRKIWGSELAKRVKRQIVQNRCPQCWTPCEAYQSIFGTLIHGRYG